MNSLIHALQNPKLFDHPVESFKIVETHISQVLLTGQFVYKIKKPVNFGFLDFSSLEKRRFYCEEELRLNRRLAPHLYIDVVAIKGSEQHPRFDGEGEVIEYAVKMRQFPQQAQLDELLSAGQLSVEIIDRLADKLAQFHSTIPCASQNSPYGDIEHIRQPMLENFTQIRQAIRDPAQISMLDEVEKWTLQQLNDLEPVIRLRKSQAYIRECHGDMHLRNIAWWNNEILIFDCIEFNPNFYWIDVMSDIAFLIMDLEDRNQQELAQRFLNRYLEISGDYQGLPLLRLYKVYRAMVRAKVDALRLSQQDPASRDYQLGLQGFRQYMALAKSYLEKSPTRMLINFGLSGSGKSVISRQLAQRLPAIQVRSDIERKRLYQMPLQGQSPLEFRQQLYSRQATDKTYARMQEIATTLLQAGYTTIIDAANLKKRARQIFVELAKSLGISYLILYFRADEKVLRERVVERAQAGEDVSDATLQVLEQQIENLEAIDDQEQNYSLQVDSQAAVDIQALIKQISSMLQA